MATALSYNAAVANQSEVSFEKMVAMIATVSSVTRNSAETIGQAFKTILTRMQAVAANKSVDEFGENINNVEKSLRSAGIEIRDTATTFRSMEDVLDEVASKWDTFGTTQQEQIAGALGGLRQANTLLTLFQNYGDVQKYMTAETESAGLAMKNYEVYLQGVEAAQNKMTASWENLAMGSVTSEMVSGFYNATAKVLDFIDAIGGIPVILTIVTGALVAFNWATIAAFATNPITIWIAAISAAVIGIGYLVNSIETAQEKLESINKEIEESDTRLSKLRDSAKSISDLSSKYEELSSKTGKTKEESQQFLDVQNQLKELVPSLSGHFDEYGNFILDASNDMAALNEETLEQIRLEKELRQAKINEKAESQAQSLLSLQKKKISTSAKGGTLYSESEKIQINLDWSNAIKESKLAFSEMSVEAKRAFISELESSGAGGAEIAKIFIEEMNAELADQEVALFGSPESLDEKAKETGSKIAEGVYDGFSATLKSLADTSSVIDDLISKSNEGGLSMEDAAGIPEEYLSALTVIGDKLKINIDLLKQTQLEQAATALSAIQSAYDQGDATSQQVAVVQFAYDQLLAQSQNTFGAFNQTAWAYDELLWQIANDANAAGFQFMDMEGKALQSASDIHGFLASSDQAFNSFVVQAAQATGRSAQEIMSVINGMVAQTYNNTVSMINGLGGMIGGMSPDERDEARSAGMNLPKIKQAAPVGGSLFGGYTAPSYGGGGGGGSSAKDDREKEQQEELRQIEQDIADARSEAIDDLKDQLSIFKDITDEKKKQLDLAADERQYNQDVEDKNKELLKVKTELNALQFDDSEEANARRLALEDELANLNQELGNIQYDQSLEQQKAAIDAEYEAFQASVNNAIRAIEDISAGSVEAFASQLASVLAGMSVPAGVPTYHSGAEQGLVGGSGTSVKGNEILAKLLRGEVVSTPEQGENFIKNTLPQLVQGASVMNGGDMSVTIPISVAGNLDRSVLPDLETMIKKAVEQLNKNMLGRGYTRRAESFGN